jgi:hypothetical protein
VRGGRDHTAPRVVSGGAGAPSWASGAGLGRGGPTRITTAPGVAGGPAPGLVVDLDDVLVLLELRGGLAIGGSCRRCANDADEGQKAKAFLGFSVALPKNQTPCTRVCAGLSGGADGTRTRGLRRDRPAL